MSVSVCVRASGGIVDPVQDDEAHAADHDHEAAQQESGGLDRRTVSHLANVFTCPEEQLLADVSGILLTCRCKI